MEDAIHGMMLVFAQPEAVTEPRSAMPPYARYAWYAGIGKDGKPDVWVAAPSGDAKDWPRSVFAEFRRENEAATILATLDAGQGTPLWRSLYATIPDDPQRRTSFAREIVAAFENASLWTVENSDATKRWIYAHVLPGMSRAHVEALFAQRSIKLEKGNATDPAPYVVLDGAFEPGCSFSTHLIVTFDANDRVEKLDLGEPIPDCL